MNRQRRIHGRGSALRYLLLFLPLLACLAYAPTWASEHGDGKENSGQAEQPKNAFDLILAYTAVTVGPGQDFEMDAEVVNPRKEPVQVLLATESFPEGWEVGFHSRYPSFPVRATMVRGEKSNTMEFKVKVPEKTEPGDYSVTVTARDSKGVTHQTEKVTFRVSKEKIKIGGLKLESQYPNLSGPTRQTFKFSLDLKNETDKDLTAALGAQAPPGWRVKIKPQFEDTQISSIALKKDASQTLSLEVDPPILGDPGDYAVTVKARSGSLEAEKELKLTLTGTYDLKVGTESGTLNTAVTAGKESQVVFLIGNAGTAPLSNLSFLSKKPEEWKIKFDPDKVDALNAGEVREVKMEIETPRRSIPGDYLLTVISNSPEANKSLDFRVTVTTPTVWGWIGAGIVALVVVGLGAVFVRLGRR